MFQCSFQGLSVEHFFCKDFSFVYLFFKREDADKNNPNYINYL